jgi:hypothetical protein
MIEWLLKRIKPLIKWIGKQHVPFSHKKITGEHYYQMRDQIKPGCILLTVTRGELSNLINPGEMKHAAVYVGGQTIKYVVEAVGKGVVQTDLVTFLTTKDEVVILDPLGGLDAMRYKIAACTKTQIGKAYDFLFSFATQNKYYCAELIYNCIMEADPSANLNKTTVYGQDFVRPDDFLNDANNWKVVYDSREK